MNIHSIDSNVQFPDMEHYDMGKASDMALYLAHCDFYPFRSVIENNKIALDAIAESYRNLAEEARLKNDFVTEQWAMTSGSPSRWTRASAIISRARSIPTITLSLSLNMPTTADK